MLLACKCWITKLSDVVVQFQLNFAQNHQIRSGIMRISRIVVWDFTFSKVCYNGKIKSKITIIRIHLTVSSVYKSYFKLHMNH